jgi:hypothetical protein
METASDTCGCCEGIEPVTPEPVVNRPGLDALAYRVGTHSSFLETMLARLSSHALPPPAQGPPRPLRALTTREPSDPSIALLDGWATVADVLTFYQERIANEGYLRTAEERRSVLELARLIGYRMRPGVAATAWLALELDSGYTTKLAPKDIKARSVPGPDETPQTFENVEPIEARGGWNQLRPRLSQPQTLSSIIAPTGPSAVHARLQVQGITTDLKPHDVVLITADEVPQALLHVAEVTKDAAADRTLVRFQEAASPGAGEEGYRIDAAALRQAAAAAALQAEAAGVGGTATFKRVSELLVRIQQEIAVIQVDAQSAEAELLPYLEALREIGASSQALEDGAVDWVQGVLEGFEVAIAPVRDDAAREAAADFARAVHPDGGIAVPDPSADPLRSVMAGLTKKPSLAPRSPQAIDRDLSRVLAKEADTGLQLTGALSAGLAEALPAALAGVTASPRSKVRAHVFRAVARPFGHNAPARAVLNDTGETSYTSYAEWTLTDPLGAQAPGSGPTDPNDPVIVHAAPSLVNASAPPLYQAPNTLYLDSEYKVEQSGWAVVERPPAMTLPATLFVALQEDAETVAQVSLTAYGISGKSTRIDLKGSKAWLSDQDATLAPVRQTLVHCESEELTLAEEPITEPIGAGGSSDWIELDGLYSGLVSGRWVVVEGEREDVLDESGAPVPGVQAAELAMIAEVVHRTKELPADAPERGGYGSAILPGDTNHTFIRLAEPLAYAYRRETVTMHGNLVKATHGETRTETLGSGDASKAFQSFELKQTPLTYIPAPTPAGAESTLEVYVNDVRWHEADHLNDLGVAERGFVTRTGDQGKTRVVFGNGTTGARLPTGLENLRAVYRSGIGKAGNLNARQISQLAARPLGVKGVINPLRSSGGSDREDRDTARENAPRTVTALDRLVSVSDYADFARTFAGIGKAVSTTISDGRREWVHLTIAGAEDIPIDENSDLYRNLRQALRDFGEPNRAVAVQVREALLVVIGARVRIRPGYLWEKVAEAVRAELLDRFGFARRALGQDLVASEIVAVIQAVEGVAWVDLDTLGGLPERKTDTGADGKPVRRLLTPQELAEAAAAFIAGGGPSALPQQRLRVNRAGFDAGLMRPAQVAYVTPAVADTLVLNQVQEPAV